MKPYVPPPPPSGPPPPEYVPGRSVILASSIVFVVASVLLLIEFVLIMHVADPTSINIFGALEGVGWVLGFALLLDWQVSAFLTIIGLPKIIFTRLRRSSSRGR